MLYCHAYIVAPFSPQITSSFSALGSGDLDIITPVKQKRGNATDVVASSLYKKISGVLPLMIFIIFHLAGDEGFEPPNAGTRTQCLTTWRIPNTPILAQNAK